MTTDVPITPPAGWSRHTRRSPLTDPWEPLLAKLDGAKPGEWLEVRPSVLKVRRTLAFVDEARRTRHPVRPPHVHRSR